MSSGNYIILYICHFGKIITIYNFSEHDRWKEEFLKEIRAEYSSRILAENSKYRIIGVPSFYDEDHENEFKEDLDNALNSYPQNDITS